MPVDVCRRWLDRLATAGPGEAGPPPTMQELFLELSEDNPQLQGVARYLELCQQSVAEDDDADPGEPEEPDEPEASPPSSAMPRAELVQLLRNLFDEVEELRERNDSLAAALGACYLCWGQDPSCPRCHGGGSPGALRPDRMLFARWIAPALRRWRHGRPGASETADTAQRPTQTASPR